MYKKAFFQIITFTAALLVLISVFSWAIDPYQVFRDHWFHLPTYSPQMRIQAPGLIRKFIENTYEYDTVVIGASLSQNYPPSKVSKILGGQKTLQLSLSGGSPKEQSIVLDKALATGKIKNVLIGIHAFYVNNDIDRMGRPDFPGYLYSGLPLQYLLSLQTIKKSILALTQRTGWQSDIDGVVNWMESQKTVFDTFNSPQNLAKLTTQLEKTRQEAPPSQEHDNNKTFKSIDRYILDKAKKHPEIQFYCILPPYSTLYYALQDKDQLDTLLSMEQYLVAQSDKFANLHVYCFQNQFDITDNLANYRDLEHFSEAVSIFVLDRIGNGKAPTTTKNWQAAEDGIRDRAAKYEVYSDQNGKLRHRPYL